MGTALGMVIGGFLEAAGCAAATLPTGGLAAVGLIGAVSLASRVGATIGSAIEDSLT